MGGCPTCCAPRRAGPSEMTAVSSREAALVDALSAHQRLVVAFSGGVDSTYLLAVAADVLGAGVIAATAVSPSLPASERTAARDVASRLGVRHIEVHTDEAERAAYRRNDPDRCFHCKSALFDALTPILAAAGDAAVAVGTITDDLSDHRPGQRAAVERGAITPLADAGLSKRDVRELSRMRGLPTWDKPAAACLASRVVYGLAVTPARLSRIERAESWLRARLPARTNIRVRDHGQTASIEVDADQIPSVVAFLPDAVAELHDLGWSSVALDKEGFRSGKLNRAL